VEAVRRDDDDGDGNDDDDDNEGEEDDHEDEDEDMMTIPTTTTVIMMMTLAFDGSAKSDFSTVEWEEGTSLTSSDGTCYGHGKDDELKYSNLVSWACWW
jgi:hypothetical protein